MDDYQGQRSPGAVIACLVLFTAAMLAVDYGLHKSVPPALSAADNAIGPAPVGIIMLAAWCIGAWLVYRPMLARWLAERRR